MSQQKNSILINEHGLNREPIPLNKRPPHLMISLIHLLVGLVQLFGLYSSITLDHIAQKTLSFSYSDLTYNEASSFLSRTN